MKKILSALQGIKQRQPATEMSDRYEVAEPASVYSLRSADERKPLLPEQSRTIESLVGRVCRHYDISPETVNSVFESHFGIGGFACLQQRDYLDAVRLLAHL